MWVADCCIRLPEKIIVFTPTPSSEKCPWLFNDCATNEPSMWSCSSNATDSNQPIGDQINGDQVLDMSVKRKVRRFYMGTTCMLLKPLISLYCIVLASSVKTLEVKAIVSATLQGLGRQQLVKSIGGMPGLGRVPSLCVMAGIRTVRCVHLVSRGRISYGSRAVLRIPRDLGEAVRWRAVCVSHISLG